MELISFFVSALIDVCVNRCSIADESCHFTERRRRREKPGDKQRWSDGVSVLLNGFGKW